jgi:hypothetical protein
MRKLRLVVLCCFCAGCFGQSLPEGSLYESGDNFLRACEDTPKVPESVQLTCFGYVNGVIDGAEITTEFFLEYAKKDAHAFCADPKVTYGQKYRIVLKYIKAHPEKSHQQTRLLVIQAMLDAFPCPDH